MRSYLLAGIGSFLVSAIGSAVANCLVVKRGNRFVEVTYALGTGSEYRGGFYARKKQSRSFVTNILARSVLPV